MEDPPKIPYLLVDPTPPNSVPEVLFPATGSFRRVFAQRTCPTDRDNLTRVSTWRVRTGLSVSNPVSARHTAPLCSSNDSRQSGSSDGRRVMTGHGAGRGTPGQAARVAVVRTAVPSVPRPDWTGRGGSETHQLLLLQPFLHLVPTSWREEATGSPPYPLRSGGGRRSVNVPCHGEGLGHIIAPIYDNLVCGGHLSVILKTALKRRHNCSHFTDEKLGAQVSNLTKVT